MAIGISATEDEERGGFYGIIRKKTWTINLSIDGIIFKTHCQNAGEALSLTDKIVKTLGITSRG